VQFPADGLMRSLVLRDWDGDCTSFAGKFLPSMAGDLSPDSGKRGDNSFETDEFFGQNKGIILNELHSALVNRQGRE
jgi:hypothetical protein